jgi:D-alanyl-D-alanine-carboxypeptidase/D-alanyl-D-alanine-endopeptidase
MKLLPKTSLRAFHLSIALLALVSGFWARLPAAHADPFLDEIVEFNGAILFLETGVPALVIGAVRNGEISVKGFGERAGPGSPPPEGDTLLRIGSVTKAFAGQVLAQLTADDKVKFADPLVKLLPDLGASKDPNVQKIRLIDLVTHAGGLPREVPHEPSSDNDPFAPITPQAFASWLKSNDLLFAPGTSVLYSNFGFDLLAMALSAAAKKPYPDLLTDQITGPLGMKDTVFTITEEQKARLMLGHEPDGTVMPVVPTGPVIVGSGGLYSTPNDLLRWMQWHLDRSADKDAEARLLDHGLYLMRDGLEVVSGMDESGHMDALGLAWVAMMPEADRPFILQKAGALQGTFCYVAFSPARNTAVVVALNKFDFGAALKMAEVANELLAALAPR